MSNVRELQIEGHNSLFFDPADISNLTILATPKPLFENRHGVVTCFAEQLGHIRMQIFIDLEQH